jgi:hypothetical protein
LDRLYIVAFLLGVILIGFISIRRKLKTVNENIIFEDEFLSNLKKFVEQQDMNMYGWLIHRSHKMQTMMGSYGILAQFQLPYKSYIYQNYPVILNVIPMIQQSFSTFGLENMGREYATLVHEAILRHIGAMEDKKEALEKDIINPLTIIREGMQSIVKLPLLILFSFGLLNRRIYDVVSASGVFKVVSGIIGFIGFLSAVVGLITGWEQFIKMLDKLLTQI